jgi:hypothetical protein
MTAARQFSSRDFWSERRCQYELVVSELGLESPKQQNADGTR